MRRDTVVSMLVEALKATPEYQVMRSTHGPRSALERQIIYALRAAGERI